MCMCSDLFQSLPRSSPLFHGRRLKRFNVQVRRLNRRRSRRVGRKESQDKKVMVVGEKTETMELKNWKLYMENQSIIQENERLRKRALLLHQENQALFSQLQNKFKSFSHNHH